MKAPSIRPAFDGILIVGASKTPEYVNKTIGQIAREEGKEPIDALCDVLLANDASMQGVYFNQCASDLLRIMAHPRSVPGFRLVGLPRQQGGL